MGLTPNIEEVCLAFMVKHLVWMAYRWSSYNTGENILSSIQIMTALSWERTSILQDWVDSILVSIFNGKGSKSNCDHYCRITLLEAVGKVLAKLLLNRLMEYICPKVILKLNVRSVRGTMDMIFSARQIQEKCIEQQIPLFQVFVDIKKAFDTVNREVLWNILGKLGCRVTSVHMLKQLHRNMKAWIIVSGKLSNKMSVSIGVKQRDILASTLFSIYFAVLLIFVTLVLI